MRALPTAWLTEIDKRGGISPRLFIKFWAQNRTTLATEALCLWSGADVQEFTMDGMTDIYYGAGAIMSVGILKSDIGTQIRRLSISLSYLTPEVAMLLRGYNVKNAQVRIWNMLFDTGSGLPIAPAVRRFKGFVNKAPIRTPEQGGVGSADLELMSSARFLSKRVPAKYSHADQKLRDPNDTMLQYIGVSGLIQTPWGVESTDKNVPLSRPGFLGVNKWK